MVRACVPFIIGILLCAHFNVKIPYDFPLLIFTTGIFWWFARKSYAPYKLWRFGTFYVFTFMLLGYITCFHANDLNCKNFFGHQLSEEKIAIQGIVNEEPLEKNWTKVILKIDALQKDSIWEKYCGKLQIYIETDSNTQKLDYGDQIVIYTNPTEIAPPNNPHSFDQKRFLKYKNIHFQGFVRKNEWQILKTGQGNFLFAAAHSARKRFLKVLRKHLKGDNEYAVGSALILGYKIDLSEDIRAAYAETGAIHVLAVSGLHVGIIYLFLSYFIRPFYNDPAYKVYGKLVILLGSIWGFAILTGGSPSVLRAATMFSFFIYGKYLFKYSFAFNTLAVSAFFLLLIDPFLLFQVGFQLSYAAVAGIIYFQNRIRVLWISMNDILYHIWQLTTVSISAQLTVLPLSLFYFNQIPVYFLLTGFVVVDAAFVILALGIALLFLEMTVPFLATYVGILLDWIIWGVNSFIFLVQKIPYGLLEGISISIFTAILMYLIIWQMGRFWEHKKGPQAIWGMSFLLIFSGFYAFKQFQNFDTKQIVVYDAGKENMIIDFIYDQKIISLTSGEITDKILKYNVEGNRKALKINEIQSINIDSIQEFKSSNLLWKKPFIQFFDQRIVVLENDVSSDTSRIKTDFVLLKNNPKIEIEKLNQVFHFKNLIADASNKFWKTEQWKTACEERNIDFHYIKKDGAMIVDLD